MLSGQSHDDSTVAPMFGLRAMTEPIPKWRIAERGLEAPAAYQLVHDELELDGNPLLNLASFVTTWMEPEATLLMAETRSKNLVDAPEYPQTAEIERRCVSIIADLFHAQAAEGEAMGTSTIGSSEAIHLCGLAMKWRWRKAREAAGKPADRPNIVMGSNVQVVWEKFVRYFDVEPRYVDMTPERNVIGVDEAMALVDENTIGVVAILGTTYTGEFEPVADLDAALRTLNAERGWDVPIHVDAASGGFVAPFAYPELVWDFRLETVRSINVSGHKYGLVYPGLGWAIWRSRDDLPAELLFHDAYLGEDQVTFNLNFSRAASQVLAQYYNFLRLGREGYTRIMRGLLDTTGYLADLVEAHDRFVLMSSRDALPVLAVRQAHATTYSCHDLAEHLSQRGWIVPAYTMPPKIEDVDVLRVVVREGFSRDMAEQLVDDAGRAVIAFDRNPPAAPKRRPHHRSAHHVC